MSCIYSTGTYRYFAMATSASPFRISPQDEAALKRNDAFRAVREHLRRRELGTTAPSFCLVHRHTYSHDEQTTFRLHRDIIHTLLLPLFLLHRQASQVASSVLPCRPGRRVESERVFRGDARSAFAWLHSILSEERDWYVTEQCAACIVLHVLHSEPTIRLMAVACLLAGALDESASPCRLAGFDFWLEAVETAVREDPFWGDEFWPDIEYRARGLVDGVKQLVLQCVQLRTTADGKASPSRCSTPHCTVTLLASSYTRRKHVRRMER